MSASLPLGRCIFFIKTQSFNLIIDTFLNLLISNVCSTMDTFQKAQLNFTRTRTSKLLRRVVLLFVSFLATRKYNLRYNVKQSFLRIYVPFFIRINHSVLNYMFLMCVALWIPSKSTASYTRARASTREVLLLVSFLATRKV